MRAAGGLGVEDRTTAAQAARLGLGCLPGPGQKLIEPLDVVIVDAGQHVAQPGLGIDIVEPGRLNELTGPFAARAASSHCRSTSIARSLGRCQKNGRDHARNLSVHGSVHRLANPIKIMLEIEVQVGSYLGED